MKMFLAAITLIHVLITSHGQSFQIEEISDTSGVGAIYRFPILLDETDAARRINRTIQEGELELVVGNQDSSIFEKIWQSGDGYSGITEFDYSVLEDSPMIFSIVFVKEACGAYCESYGIHYNFDATTGERITLKKLFGEDGIKRLGKKIIEERRAQVQKVINSIDTSEEGLVKKEMYSTCLDYLTEAHFEHGSFFIENAVITFIGSRCSSHYGSGFDDIGEFVNELSFEELEPYLTPYGKSLLSR